jgi:hypothetical protein
VDSEFGCLVTNTLLAAHQLCPVCGFSQQPSQVATEHEMVDYTSPCTGGYGLEQIACCPRCGTYSVGYIASSYAPEVPRNVRIASSSSMGRLQRLLTGLRAWLLLC